MQEKALLDERAKLIERNKELSCLYEIAKIVAHTETTVEEVLQAIVDVVPSAFQFPDQVCARIVVDDKVFMTEGFSKYGQMIRDTLQMDPPSHGAIEVFYHRRDEAEQELEDGFFPEERKLLQAIAHQVSQMINIKLANEKRAQLENQLRHSDRLAKVGQLTAGVAHELNEPLVSILGFAQLATKKIDAPVQAARYLDKIIQSTLHAREVIKKMMLFSSPMPYHKSKTDLNHVLTEGMAFIEPRFSKVAIRFNSVLDPELPMILADASQITQVLINLVINAIHAMDSKGTLTLRTAGAGMTVQMIVQDTGTGMDQQTMEQIFLPFFTTKDLDHGTGLGLSVVHGIVSAHDGTINVESRVGQGTTFTITFPAYAGKDR
ncbi:MAG: ATP-binding protein [Desulfobulbus sp.]|jgi:signal transduction histidine kinase|nr:ATP-binding protein [Desulfobulbus sp.]